MNFHTVDNEDDEKTFMERHRVVLSVAAVVVIAVIVTLMQRKFSSGGGTSHKAPEIVSVRLSAPLPTPPPPPPTPPQEIKVEQKMIEQAPVNDQEEKPKDEPPPASSLTTGIKGDGPPDGFGVASGDNGMIGGSGSTRQHSKWGWYAAQVQGAIAETLKKNPRTRGAVVNLKIRVWSDATGRITRAKAAEGDGGLQAEAIIGALTGLQLKEAPPEGMPQPIVLRITAQRPN